MTTATTGSKAPGQSGGPSDVVQPARDQLPEHIAQTVAAVEGLHLRHTEEASRFELMTERAAHILGRPVLLAALTLMIASWLLAGWITDARAYADLAPADWLEVLLTIFAVYVTLLILAGQRKQERLATHLQQLTLQMSLLNEQKSAKIIALLEEFRRDDPRMTDRLDPEAEAMAAKADAQQVSEAISEIAQVNE